MNALATEVLPIVVALGVDDIAGIEVTDPELPRQDLERITLGFGGIYVTVESPDLVATAAGLDTIKDRIIEAVLDARQEQLDAEQHDCYCKVRLDSDERTCGARACEQLYIQDAQA